uniref:Uncharacterized protein n=1 Tax=viral metagenome TaxID=1070528 RepID=A0A6C0KZG7_9ZZZZ|tara:strand:- start:1272 stop:1430 length:159 start_codon:yes stop_codon:yes gene_type:complete
MGLIRAIIITCLCYYGLEKFWFSDKNPLPKSKKKEYEKVMLFSIIFLVEMLI